jgi:hypothetical protein
MARTSASSRELTDHDEIQQWAEERGGKPACVRGTGGKNDVGMIRLDFPGYSGGDSLEEIPWDEWFEKFDESNLALLVQDETARGQRSNFNKLVSRSNARQRSRRGGSRKQATRQEGRAAARRGTSARGRTAKTTRKSSSTRSAGTRNKAAKGRGQGSRTASSGRSSRSSSTRTRGTSSRTSATTGNSRSSQGRRSSSRRQSSTGKVRSIGRASRRNTSRGARKRAA